MSTHDTDMIRIHTTVFGIKDFPMKEHGLEWPPPEYLYLDAEGGFRPAMEDDDPMFVLRRTSMSQLTYEQADHRSLARGASYYYLSSGEQKTFAINYAAS